MPTARTRPDGGRTEPPVAPDRAGPTGPERPADTSYASPYTRDEEEIEPFVEDLR